jgi:hypothetical protein
VTEFGSGGCFLVGRRKYVSSIGRLQGLWSIRATEREVGIDRVLSQWNLIFCGLNKGHILSWFSVSNAQCVEITCSNAYCCMKVDTHISNALQSTQDFSSSL